MNSLARSMKAKLIVLFLAVSIVPLSTVAVLSFNTAEAELNRTIGKGLHAIAADRANSLNIINEMRMREAGAFASATTVQSIIALDSMMAEKGQGAGAGELDRRKAEFREEAARFFEGTAVGYTKNGYYEPIEGEGFYDAKIVSAKGPVIVATNEEEEGSDLSKNSFFLKGLVHPSLSMEYDKEANVANRIVRLPVRDSGGNTVAVLMAEVPTKYAGRVLHNYKGLGETGESYVVNGDKLVITESRFTKGLAWKQQIDTRLSGNALKTAPT